MKNKIALITGASSGIGKAYAELLAGKKYDPLLVARREKVLKEMAGEIAQKHGVKVQVLAADLSRHEGLEPVKNKVSKMQDIEVMVHAAGFGTRGFVEELEPALLEQQVFLHNVAATVLTRAVLPGMIRNGKGYLIYISSVAAFISTANYPVYSATKAFLNTFATGLRDEVLPKGVRVQSVCPGITQTGFMYTEQYKDFDYSFIPEKFWMTPDEVATEAWEKITQSNKVIHVSGGYNRMLVKLLKMPLLGSLIKSRISKKVRKKIAKGEPVNF
jgi:short-subunit dehydrogenase